MYQNFYNIFKEFIEEYGEDFLFYMDNNPKHISIKSLEFYKEKKILIELEHPQSTDLNIIENNKE